MVNIWKLKKSLRHLAKQKAKCEKKRDLFRIRQIKEEQQRIKLKIMDLKKSRNMREKNGIK